MMVTLHHAFKCNTGAVVVWSYDGEEIYSGVTLKDNEEHAGFILSVCGLPSGKFKLVCFLTGI